MLKEFILSFQSYWQAHQFIRQHRLWKWIIIPGVVYAFILFVGFHVFLSAYDDATKFIIDELHLNKWLNKLETSWLSFFFIISKVFLDLLLIFICFSFYRFFLMIIGAPVFSFLSEKTEALVNGIDMEFDFGLLLNDVVRGIKVAIRNMGWQLVYMFAFIFVTLIPLIGWVCPLVLIFMDCYYVGFSMLDYSNKRNGITESKSYEMIAHHRGLAIGNGMLFYALHIIPFIGWIFAPSYAVVAATLSLHNAKIKNIIA
jgi:CysZ protein